KSCNSPWTWGVGVFGVGGFSTNFPASPLGGGNPVLQPQPFGIGQLFTHAEIYQVIPTISYAATEKLSFGVAPILDLAFLQADPPLFGPPSTGFPIYPGGP